MSIYTLEKTVETKMPLSENVIAVAEMFGLGTRRDRRIKLLDNCRVCIRPGQVVYITGGSGAGKTLILNLLRQQINGALDIRRMKIPRHKPLVDCFAGQSLIETMQWLSLAGLSDAFAVLRSEDQLSDGQRYRFRLAQALFRRPPAICMDEFCACLDRVTAAVVAHNVRKAADKFGITFLVATSHDDLLEDLQPDVVLIKHLGSGCDVYYPGGLQEDVG